MSKKIMLILATCFVSFISIHSRAADPSLEKGSINSSIKEFILNNPEVIIESLEKLNARKAEAARTGIKDYLSGEGEKFLKSAKLPTIGNIDSKKFFTVISDYNCGYCEKYSKTLNEFIVNNNKNIKVIYIPIGALGEASDYKANLALAGNILYKHKYDQLNKLLVSSRKLDQKSLLNKVKSLDIDMKKIEELMKKEEFLSLKKGIYDLVLNIGVRGVPVTIIGTKSYSGALSLDDLKDLMK